MTNADTNRSVVSSSGKPPAEEREWKEAKRRGHGAGWARRYHRQPFPWTVLYTFIGDDAEDAVVISGEELNLGATKAKKRDASLDQRKGPDFHALVAGRHGVARVIPGGPAGLSWGRWDFLADDGVATVVPDTAIEVFTSWGFDTAVNVWANRAAARVTRGRRARALRSGVGREGRGRRSARKTSTTTGTIRPKSGTTGDGRAK